MKLGEYVRFKIEYVHRTVSSVFLQDLSLYLWSIDQKLRRSLNSPIESAFPYKNVQIFIQVNPFLHVISIPNGDQSINANKPTADEILFVIRPAPRIERSSSAFITA